MAQIGPIAVRLVFSAEQQSLTSVDAIGDALSAGTNCGSCRPAIAQILAQVESEEKEMVLAAE